MNPPRVERFRPCGQTQFVSYGTTISILLVVLSLARSVQLTTATSGHGVTPWGGGLWDWVLAGILLYVPIPLLGLTLFMLADGILTVLEITEGGIAWKRWGGTRWFIPWSDYAGWRWEQRPGGRAPRALLLLEGAGDEPRVRRVSKGWHTSDAGPFYKAVLAALTERAPEKGERP